MKGKELIKRYEDLRLRKEELKTNLKKTFNENDVITYSSVYEEMKRLEEFICNAPGIDRPEEAIFLKELNEKGTGGVYLEKYMPKTISY